MIKQNRTRVQTLETACDLISCADMTMLTHADYPNWLILQIEEIMVLLACWLGRFGFFSGGTKINPIVYMSTGKLGNGEDATFFAVNFDITFGVRILDTIFPRVFLQYTATMRKANFIQPAIEQYTYLICERDFDNEFEPYVATKSHVIESYDPQEIIRDFVGHIKIRLTDGEIL